MDVNINRLRLVADTEKELTKSCAMIDYAETKRILESVNNAILAGVKVNSIVKILDEMKDIQQRHSGGYNLKDYFE